MVDNSLLVKYFPASLAELSASIGVDACLKLIDAYGGRRIYVPKSINQDSLLGKLGAKAASCLEEQYGGTFLSIPVASRLKKFLRNSNIAEEKKTKSTQQIAKDFDLTERQVWTILRNWREENATAISSPNVA